MMVINVKYQDGVFVPLEQVNIGEVHEAVVVVSDKKTEKPEELPQFYQQKARQYFKDNFPELEVSEDILDLVGILSKYSGKYDKSEYHEYLGRKYK